MNENKTTTYGDLKIRKQELRDKGIMGVNMEEYLQNMNAIKDAEAVLLWGIVWEDIEPEQARRKKCRTGALICFAIAGIAAVILAVGLFGCNVAREGLHLVGAAGQDVGWMANKVAENINTEK